MIAFQGKLSAEVLKRNMQIVIKTCVGAMMFLIVLGGIPISLMFLLNDTVTPDIFWGSIFIGGFVGLFISVCFILMLTTIAELKKNVAQTITIKADEGIFCRLHDQSSFYPAEALYEFASVTDVREYAECYIIYFSYVFRSKCVVCQKDLLTEGTLEEFEAFFEDRLIKKKVVIKN